MIGASLSPSPTVQEIPVTLTPLEAFERISDLPYPLFLDSALPDAHQGRYAFITADPFEFVSFRSGRLSRHPVHSPSMSDAREETTASANVFLYLKDRLAAFPASTLEGLPPFQGGLAGLFSYDLCHQVERLPRPLHDEFQFPDLAVGLYDWVLAFDLQEEMAWILSHGFPEGDPDRRRSRAEARVRAVQALLARPAFEPVSMPGHPPLPPSALADQTPVRGPDGLTSNFSREAYLEAVRKIIDYIAAGDIFQANLSQRLLFPAREHPLRLYRRLRALNPASFSAYFHAGGLTLASASPERFLQVRLGQVETRPIKGTRPRSPDPARDQAMADELRRSEKDRAENVMIVDLLRNDLSRVCVPGSVRVQELFRLESTPFVHHLVSVIQGRLAEGKCPLDLLRAAFPGGSITGAPKVRAMEIIAELEPTARGPYCGCLGYVGFDGCMDTSILIRTFIASRGWLQFPVGGGIVSQSVPELEYEETFHKAQGLLAALPQGA